MEGKMKRNGFNLIETTVSLSLISFLMLFSIPSFKSLISKLNFKSAQSQVINSLYLCRYKSAFTGDSYRWKALGDSIVIERESVGKWILEKRIKLDYGNLSANNTPVFHPEGLVTNMATIYLRSKNLSSKITVAITGRIKVEDGN
jgi:type II secretory pathway pseudopilin PulG